jgi:hypothetical protein
MARESFVVAPIGDRWIVSTGADSGSRIAYERREHAIREAIQAAHASGRLGNHAQVLTLDNDVVLTPIWTYGQDGFTGDVSLK